MNARHPPNWTVTVQWEFHGRYVGPETELTIMKPGGEGNISGRWLFVEHVRTDTGIEWITVQGGKNNHTRSFQADQIRIVHRIPKMRDAAPSAKPTRMTKTRKR